MAVWRDWRRADLGDLALMSRRSAAALVRRGDGRPASSPRRLDAEAHPPFLSDKPDENRTGVALNEEPRPERLERGGRKNPGTRLLFFQTMRRSGRRREFPVPPVPPIAESGNSSSGRCRRNHVRENAQLAPVMASVFRVTPPREACGLAGPANSAARFPRHGPIFLMPTA
jgi:hypothetical protein